MPNLKPSLCGENYTDEEQREMWIDIHDRSKCPQCGAEDLILQEPHGGPAVNIKCNQCKMVFWISRSQRLGAYPIRSEVPEVEEGR